jgi:hypothetical protein
MKFLIITYIFIFPVIFFSQENYNKQLSAKKCFALEICNKEEFNLCSNRTPVSISKEPEFFRIDPFTKGLNFDTVYRLAPLNWQKLNVFQHAKLRSKFEKLKSKDTIKDCFSKSQTRKVNRRIKKIKKRETFDMEYSFSGCLNYLVFDMKNFTLEHIGNGTTYIANKKGRDLIIAKKITIYYIVDIAPLAPE